MTDPETDALNEEELELLQQKATVVRSDRGCARSDLPTLAE